MYCRLRSSINLLPTSYSFQDVGNFSGEDTARWWCVAPYDNFPSFSHFLFGGVPLAQVQDGLQKRGCCVGWLRFGLFSHGPFAVLYQCIAICRATNMSMIGSRFKETSAVFINQLLTTDPSLRCITPMSPHLSSLQFQWKRCVPCLLLTEYHWLFSFYTCFCAWKFNYLELHEYDTLYLVCFKRPESYFSC